MHFYGKTSSVRYTNENHIAAVFVQSVFTDYSTRAANLIASESVSYTHLTLPTKRIV